MTADEILPALGKKLSKNRIITLRRKFRKSGGSLNELVGLTLSADTQVAWRAAWLLENVLIGKMAFYVSDIPMIIQTFPGVKNPGAKRHYAKMMARITNPRSALLQKIVSEKDLEKVAEASFDWLIDEQIRVAVKSFCIEILFNLRHRFEWVREELPEQVEYVMENGTAGIQAKGRKILSALRHSPFT